MDARRVFVFGGKKEGGVKQGLMPEVIGLMLGVLPEVVELMLGVMPDMGPILSSGQRCIP